MGVDLVLGPSLGADATQLWRPLLERLPPDVRAHPYVLPGHGAGALAPASSIRALAASVLDWATARGLTRFHYLGVSIGGAVGLEIALGAPDVVESLTIACSSARLGDPAGWRARAASVRAGGMRPLAEGIALRWFGAPFAERHPEHVARAIEHLACVNADDYALLCEALADWDRREAIARITVPLLVIVGALDPIVPVADGERLAAAAERGALLVLDDAAHLAPLESPDPVAVAVAAALRGHDPVPPLS